MKNNTNILELWNQSRTNVTQSVGVGGAYFVISIRKSGSTMVTKIAELICAEIGIDFIDIGSWLFDNNIPATTLYEDDDFCHLLRSGTCFAGFRDYPVVLRRSDLFIRSKKLLFVRDPRDALVSEYFSNSFSHDMPLGDSEGHNYQLMKKLREEALAEDINSYVKRRAKDFLWTASHFVPYLNDESTLLLKYEDFIFEKEMLVKFICRHMGWALSSAAVDRIAQSVDIRPAIEDPKAFVRKITPGDHIEKLNVDTIQDISNTLRAVLDAFGYN